MRWAALIVLLALVACERKASQVSGSGSGSGSGGASDEFLPTPTFAVEEVGIPDEPGWHRAANVVARGWAESFNKIGVTAAKVSPVRSADGTVAPYVLQVEATKGTAPVFTGKALVAGGRMINGGGKARLAQHLASIGFPARHLPADLLFEMVRLTGSIDRAWFDATPTVAYDGGGAVLTLTRGGDRLEVRFAPDATLTTTP